MSRPAQGGAGRPTASLATMRGVRGVLQCSAAWLGRHPLTCCLPIQATLLLIALGRLPLWGDEDTSLYRAALAPAQLVAVLRDGIHPPLYDLLLGAWLALPIDATAIVRARALSALLLILATVALDRTWLRAVDARTRAWFLALWTLSPALLLYGRMARSYSLQLLLAPLALWIGWSAIRRPRVRASLGYGAVATLLLYTHYLPGVAVVGALGSLTLWRLATTRDRRLVSVFILPLALVGAAYAPWMSTLAATISRVDHAAPYHVVANPLLDRMVGLVFTLVSFTVGESLSPWMLVAAVPVSIGVAVLLARSARRPPDWLALVLLTAAIAVVGAEQWVSYAFVAARVLFVLPFYLLLLVEGGRGAPRLRAVVCAGLLLVSLGGMRAYFAEQGFLNKAYVIPVDAMARTIRERSGDAAPVVVLDHHSINLTAIRQYLPAQTRTIFVADDATADAAAALAGAAPAGPVWFARSLHDVSREGWNGRIEAAWTARCDVRRRRFMPYSALDRRLMRLAGWPEQPTHVVELLEMHCKDPRLARRAAVPS